MTIKTMPSRSVTGRSTAARVVASTWLLAAHLAAGGCASLNQPASSSFASVQIGGGRTEPEIRDMTVKVFEENGFETRRSSGDLLFEREGSTRDEIAYGNSFVAGERAVFIRVRAQIVPQGAGLHRLQCTAYAVRPFGAGEDETKLPFYRRGSYRDMLNEIAGRLTAVNVMSK